MLVDILSMLIPYINYLLSAIDTQEKLRPITLCQPHCGKSIKSPLFWIFFFDSIFQCLYQTAVIDHSMHYN